MREPADGAASVHKWSSGDPVFDVLLVLRTRLGRHERLKGLSMTAAALEDHRSFRAALLALKRTGEDLHEYPDVKVDGHAQNGMDVAAITCGRGLDGVQQDPQSQLVTGMGSNGH